MKRFSLYLLFFAVALLATQVGNAQKKDKKKKEHEMHIKVKVIEDGKEKIMDTVIHEFIDHDEVMKLVELKGFSDTIMKKHMVWFSGDDKDHKSNIFIKAFGSDGDSISCERMKIVKRIKKGEGHAHSYFFTSSGDSCIKKDIHVEILGEGDHKMHFHPKHGKKGEKIIIIKDSDDVEIEEKDGHKIIKIETSVDENVWIEKDGEHEVEVEVEVTTDNDKKVVKKKRKKKKEKK